MSETKFTRGPWVKTKYGNLVGSDGTKISIYDAGIGLAMADPSEEDRANASLVIASPGLYEALKAYEAWEADLILSNEAWAGGFAALPTITQELWDRFIEIQTMRNTALAKARGEQQ